MNSLNNEGVGRKAALQRDTLETQISLKLNLDGVGRSRIQTGVGFFDHMLTLLSFHSGMDLELEAKGDLEVCDHHVVEDCGIVLGQGIKAALGDKKGIARYGHSVLPMEETLAEAALDFSGRSLLIFQAEFRRDQLGTYATEMTKEFFQALCREAGLNLHLEIRRGDNDHHKVEALFKAFARGLRQAVALEGTRLLSSKGMLE